VAEHRKIMAAAQELEWNGWKIEQGEEASKWR
jgi:hypothetical protein